MLRNIKFYDSHLFYNNLERPACMMVFTREISSRMKSSLLMLKCLSLFTHFCRDEISSQDELILVKKTGMKFHPE